jgi:tetratricopeptide (TPR) repeat protein
MPSIEELEKLVQQFPTKPFPRYGLAMEYKKAGRFADSIPHFEKAMELDPNYVAAFFQAGMAYEAWGKADLAKETYRKGLVVAQRIGNGHAASEIGAALAALGG